MHVRQGVHGSFFDVVDRRYEKGVSQHDDPDEQHPTNNWDEFFTGDDTLLCTLDRLFDRASGVHDEGRELPGGGLEIFSVESSPMAIKINN